MAYYNNNYVNPYMTAIPNQMNPNVPSYAPQQPQQDTMFKWVQGRAGAEAFSLAPGTSAFLMDSNEPILYAKATDSYGRYMPLQSYKLVPMEDQMPSSQQIAQPNEPIDYEKIRQMIAEEVNNALSQNGRNNKREAK
jgi:hypothetical protein